MKTLAKISEWVYRVVYGVIFGIGIVAGLSFIALCIIAIKYWIWGRGECAPCATCWRKLSPLRLCPKPADDQEQQVLWC